MSQLNVRINHKYDLYDAWKDSTLVLGKGEFAVVEIPGETTGSGMTPPAIALKVGDGQKTFSQLPWIQATAGDVYAWAKKEHLDYADLTEEFKGKVAELVHGEVQDTNTTYQFSYENDTLTIKAKEIGQDSYDTVVATLPITLTTKVDKVTNAVAGNLAQFVEGGNIADSGEKIGDFLKKTEAEGIYATQTALGTLEETVTKHGERLDTAEGKIEDLEGAVEILNGEASVEGSVKKQVADAVAGIVNQAPEAYDTLQEIAAWIAAHPDSVATINAAIQENTRLIGENATAIGELEEDSHVHENKEVLDGVSAEKVTAWDAAVQEITGVTATKTGTSVEVTAVPVTLLNNVEGDTLVFNCGTSSTVI